MSNKELLTYLKEHSQHWEDSLLELKNQIGLTQKSYDLQKPYMLVIDDTISGSIATSFMLKYSKVPKNNNTLSLTSNIRYAFEKFNQQLPDKIRWRQLGKITSPRSADIYCPPFEEITLIKYNPKTYEVSEQLATKALFSTFNESLLFNIFFVKIPLYLLYPFSFFSRYKNIKQKYLGYKDKQWNNYLTIGNDKIGFTKITAPLNIEEVVDCIFNIYDYYHISICDKDKTTIKNHWKKGKFWPNHINKTISSLKNKAVLTNSALQINYNDWIVSLNKIIKGKINNTNYYMLCSLLLPIMSAKELLSLFIPTQNGNYVENPYITKLPRSSAEASFITGGIKNSSDKELQYYLLSLILATQSEFSDLEKLQINLIKNINPEFLNLKLNKYGANQKKNISFQQINRLISSNNKKVLIALITYGSGDLVKLANKKLIDLENDISNNLN